jgi:hypothetical protein
VFNMSPTPESARTKLLSQPQKHHHKFQVFYTSKISRASPQTKSNEMPPKQSPRQNQFDQQNLFNLLGPNQPTSDGRMTDDFYIPNLGNLAHLDPQTIASLSNLFGATSGMALPNLSMPTTMPANLNMQLGLSGNLPGNLQGLPNLQGLLPNLSSNGLHGMQFPPNMNGLPPGSMSPTMLSASMSKNSPIHSSPMMSPSRQSTMSIDSKQLSALPFDASLLATFSPQMLNTMLANTGTPGMLNAGAHAAAVLTGATSQTPGPSSPMSSTSQGRLGMASPAGLLNGSQPPYRRGSFAQERAAAIVKAIRGAGSTTPSMIHGSSGLAPSPTSHPSESVKPLLPRDRATVADNDNFMNMILQMDPEDEKVDKAADTSQESVLMQSQIQSRSLPPLHAVGLPPAMGLLSPVSHTSQETRGTKREHEADEVCQKCHGKKRRLQGEADQIIVGGGGNICLCEFVCFPFLPTRANYVVESDGLTRLGYSSRQFLSRKRNLLFA